MILHVSSESFPWQILAIEMGEWWFIVDVHGYVHTAMAHLYTQTNPLVSIHGDLQIGVLDTLHY